MYHEFIPEGAAANKSSSSKDWMLVYDSVLAHWDFVQQHFTKHGSVFFAHWWNFPNCALCHVIQHSMWLICLKHTSYTFTSLSTLSHLSYSYELCVSIFKILSLAWSHNTIHSVWCQIYSCLVDDFNDMLKKVKEWEHAYMSFLPSFLWWNLFLSEMLFFLKVEVIESW